MTRAVAPSLLLAAVLLLPPVVPLSAPQTPPLTLSTACTLSPAMCDLLASDAAIELVALEEPLSMSTAPPAAVGGAALRRCWVHAGTTIKELAAAKRMGGATVWLNKQAAKSALGDVEGQGYLGAMIIEDFADALCGNEEELAAAAVQAWVKAEEKAKADDSRERREMEQAGLTVDVDPATDDAQPPSPGIVPAPAPAPAPPPAGNPPPPAAAQSATKFCIFCGTKRVMEARFCSQCGERQRSPDD